MLVIATLCATGCSSVSNQDLKVEVTSLLGQDQFADMAMAHLEQAGFSCTVSDPRDVQCSRARSPNLLTSCTQRVILIDARLKNAFSGVAFRPVACFGGFG